MAQINRSDGLVGNAAIKYPCRVATTANITLSAAQTIDGVAVVADDRVLVKNQTTATENGIYVCDSGSWERAEDADNDQAFTEGSLVKVNNGTVGSGFWYVSNTGTITIDSTSITFARASTVLATLSTYWQAIVVLTTQALSLTALGFSTFFQTLIAAATVGALRALLGLSTTGEKVCQGRLTLTSGTPVTTADVTAAETLYFTPYKGNNIALYNGTDWAVYDFAELSIDIPDATNCYDVFAYISAGAATLELLAWTNATTRATALVMQDGVLSKTGALTRRYLGTFYSTTAGNGQVEDTLIQRNLYNYYNRVERTMRVIDTTDSWAYTTATIRQARASAANQLEYVQGVQEDLVCADVFVTALNDNGSTDIQVGVGVDSTTVNSAQIKGPVKTPQTANDRLLVEAHYTGFPGVGRHVLPWLEYSEATGTTTWIGDSGGTVAQSGITGRIFG